MVRWASPTLSVLAFMAVAVALLLVACGGDPKTTPAPAPPDRVNEPGGYTRAVVDQAVQRYKDDGRDATIDYYNTSESLDGDWYVFIIDEDDKLIAQGARPELVGEDIKGPLGTDVTGHEFGPYLLSATEQGRWVEYVFLNPEAGREERKHTWAIKHDGLIFASGWYEQDEDIEIDPPAFARAFVQSALWRYATLGREATVDYYNTMESVYGDWYVFIIDEDGVIISHATRPERRGLNFDDMVDIRGYNYGADFAATTEDGDWVSYVYQNPFTGDHEQKHSWVVRHDGLIFGSGWYEK